MLENYIVASEALPLGNWKSDKYTKVIVVGNGRKYVISGEACVCID